MTGLHPIDTKAPPCPPRKRGREIVISGLGEAQVGGHRDAVADALIDGAPRCVMRVGPLGGLALVRRAARQRVVHPDPLDDKYPVFHLDVAFGR